MVAAAGQKFIIEAEPYALEFDPAATALVVIDMQRDFLEPDGFGELLGNDVSLLRGAIDPTTSQCPGSHSRRTNAWASSLRAWSEVVN